MQPAGSGANQQGAAHATRTGRLTLPDWDVRCRAFASCYGRTRPRSRTLSHGRRGLASMTHAPLRPGMRCVWSSRVRQIRLPSSRHGSDSERSDRGSSRSRPSLWVSANVSLRVILSSFRRVGVLVCKNHGAGGARLVRSRRVCHAALTPPVLDSPAERINARISQDVAGLSDTRHLDTSFVPSVCHSSTARQLWRRACELIMLADDAPRLLSLSPLFLPSLSSLPTASVPLRVPLAV